MDRNYDCDSIIPSIIEDEPPTKKKDPFAFHEKRKAISWVSKTVNNCIKFHIIYAEKTSQFLMVDSSKKYNSMQQANHKNYSSVAFKNKNIWKDFWC